MSNYTPPTIDDLALEIARVRHGDNCTASDLAQRLTPWLAQVLEEAQTAAKPKFVLPHTDEYVTIVFSGEFSVLSDVRLAEQTAERLAHEGHVAHFLNVEKWEDGTLPIMRVQTTTQCTLAEARGVFEED